MCHQDLIPIQALGDREVFNDIEQLPGSPMPNDGNVHEVRRLGKSKPQVKDVGACGYETNKRC